MKIGCCVSLFHDAVFTLSELGVDYAEIGLSELSLHSGEEISERAERLSEAGVPCLAGNVLFPGELALTGPHTELSAISEYLGATLEKAALLGVRTVVFGSGGSRRAPEGFPREAAWEQLRGLCAELLSPALQKHGMTCCIEPLNRRECNILNTSEECACLVREVGKPNIRLLVDLYHFDLEREPLSVLAGYGDILAHAHIASAKNGRALPKEGDGEDYAAFFQALRSIGYSGSLSLEGSVSGTFEDCIAESAAYVRKFSALKA